MSDLKSYLKNRKAETQRLQAQLNKTANPQEAYKDARFWEPTVDKAGNGSATIRFLPARSPEEDAYVTRYYRSFKGPTGLYYVETDRSMLGRDTPDPVQEFNEPLWNGSAAEKKQASEQKRKVQYMANILVIDDPKNPSNNGKVFLFKFGKKTLDRLNKLSNPPPELKKKGVDPFDLIDGVNYTLIVTRKDNFPNYDDSEFSTPCAAADTDKELERIFNSMYDLRPLVAPETVKSFDECQKRLYKVLGISGSVSPEATPASASTKSAPKASKAPVVEEVGDEEDVDVDSILEDMKA